MWIQIITRNNLKSCSKWCWKIHVVFSEKITCISSSANYMVVMEWSWGSFHWSSFQTQCVYCFVIILNIEQLIYKPLRMSWQYFSHGICKHLVQSDYPDSKVYGANMGPTGPSWAPCWPHKPCYQGIVKTVTNSKMIFQWKTLNKMSLWTGVITTPKSGHTQSNHGHTNTHTHMDFNIHSKSEQRVVCNKTSNSMIVNVFTLYFSQMKWQHALDDYLLSINLMMGNIY